MCLGPLLWVKGHGGHDAMTLVSAQEERFDPG